MRPAWLQSPTLLDTSVLLQCTPPQSKEEESISLLFLLIWPVTSWLVFISSHQILYAVYRCGISQSPGTTSSSLLCLHYHLLLQSLFHTLMGGREVSLTLCQGTWHVSALLLCTSFSPLIVPSYTQWDLAPSISILGLNLMPAS